MDEPKHIPLDLRSPQAERARAYAQSLIAARLGGKSTYESEINSLFGGPRRSLDDAGLLNLLYIVDALAAIAETLAVVATLDADESPPDVAEDLQRELDVARTDPQELLKYVDKILEAIARKTSTDS